MYQKGSIFLPLILGTVLISLAAFLTYSKLSSPNNANIPSNSQPDVQNPASSSSAALSFSPTPKPTVSPKSTTSPKPAAAASATKPSPTETTTGSCTVIVLSVAENDPLIVNLTYSFTGSGNQYMAGAQWDFDGNGSWDTDLSQSNGTISHNFAKSGSFNPKLRLKISDGKMTPVCTKTISVNSGITVSFTGKVFRDNNCNDAKEPDEPGISGMPVRFFKSDYSMYKTITSGGDGDYNLTATIADNAALTIQPSPDLNQYSNVSDPSVVSYSPYKIHYDVPFATLNSNQKSINKDVPLVPSENIGSCSN